MLHMLTRAQHPTHASCLPYSTRSQSKDKNSMSAICMSIILTLILLFLVIFLTTIIPILIAINIINTDTTSTILNTTCTMIPTLIQAQMTLSARARARRQTLDGGNAGCAGRARALAPGLRLPYPPLPSQAVSMGPLAAVSASIMPMGIGTGPSMMESGSLSLWRASRGRLAKPVGRLLMRVV